MPRPHLAALAVACALAVAAPAGAVRVVVVNGDGAGEGFNDPTDVTPVGGNTATTLGGQRLQAFRTAATIWGQQLVSDVTVRVHATMDPLPCDATTATLGEAATTTVHRDFPGVLLAKTWYSQALANKLAGQDLAPSQDDIDATFNSAIGTTCPFPQPWYYGLDRAPTPGTIDFVSVVAHELAHGLGFETYVDETT